MELSPCLMELDMGRTNMELKGRVMLDMPWRMGLVKVLNIDPMPPNMPPNIPPPPWPPWPPCAPVSGAARATPAARQRARSVVVVRISMLMLKMTRRHRNCGRRLWPSGDIYGSIFI